MKKHFSLLLAGSMLIPGGSMGKEIFPKAEKIITIGQEISQEMTETFVVTGQERPHEEIIAMPFDQIFASYGKVKGLEVIREHFLIEINAFRKNLGNNEVSFSSGINDIAQEYAESIAKNGNFSHVDEDGKDVSDRADEKGITYTIISENISYNQKTIKDIIKGYKNGEKTGHFNVFKKPYTKIGFGVAKSAKGVFFSVCNYAN